MKNRSMLLGLCMFATLFTGLVALSGCKSTCGAKQASHHQCKCEKCQAKHEKKEDGSCGCDKMKKGESCSECESCKAN